jgi:hypothetical protein
VRRLSRRRELNPVLSVGGISIAIEGEGASGVPKHLHPYLTDDKKPLARCRGNLGQVDLSRETQALFDSGGVWRVDETPGGIRLVLRSGGPPGRPYHILELDADLTRGEARLDPTELEDDTRRFPLRDPLHELWTSFLLMRGRGLLLHGCGLLLDEKVHVFLGESGAGKSTLGKIFKKHGPRSGTILSDDRLVVRPEKSGYSVYGTPWHGEAQFASHCFGPLASVYFIEKADKSESCALSIREAVERLFRVCFLAGWPRTGLNFVLGMCHDVGAGVPCRRLRFRPDESALRAAGVA